MNQFNRLVMGFLFLGVAPLHAQDFGDEGITPGVVEVNPVIIDELDSLGGRWDFLNRLSTMKSDLLATMSLQTPVKSQGSRGTCAIFATTAALESLLKRDRGVDEDLSEQQLQYYVISKIWNSTDEGSSHSYNVSSWRSYGLLREEQWPYDTRSLKEDSMQPGAQEKAAELCGHLEGRAQKQCRITHGDPSQNYMLTESKALLKEMDLEKISTRSVSLSSEIRKSIQDKVPIVLSVTFFYRAWNHRLMTEYGLGERDYQKFLAGEVQVPDEEDIRVSRQHPAGHLILIVGYDDEKQVYYFKNSWGTQEFGRDSQILGAAQNTAGYGTIPYAYAHNWGSFNDLRNK